MLTGSRLSIAFVAPLILAIATPVDAQITGSIGPLVGYYRPFGHFEPASVYSTSLPREPGDLRGRALGVIGQLSFGGRLGVEAQMTMANSTLPAVITPAGAQGPTAARVTVATLQAQYDISPAPEKVRLRISAGPGLVQYGGDAYRCCGSPRSVGVALGAGVSLPVASMLQVTAGATVLRYSVDVAMPPALQGNPGSLERGMQTDAVLHLGLRWGHF